MPDEAQTHEPQLLDSRRLMGPSIHSSAPVAIAEIVMATDPAPLEALWREEAARMLARLAWQNPALATHAFAGGIALLLAASIDVLLAATEVNEWAFASAVERWAGRPALPLEPRGAELTVLLAQQSDPRLLALEREAAQHALPFLWDDDRVSIGTGARSRTWQRTALPEKIDWQALGTIPTALITGTNGKTTCARLLARIAEAAGFVVGMSSTEGVVIAGETTETGDWAGPAGARAVLRDSRVNFAVLETARGGLLRRGLAVSGVDAALITNVSADHLGAYGIDDTQAMVRAKSLIGHAVKSSGRVVLNGDDPALAALRFAAPVVLFSRHADAPIVEAHRASGGSAWLQVGDTLVMAQGTQSETVLPANDVPITFSGRAPYNIENALAASATAHALGLPLEAIRAGLHAFADNPGRAEIHLVGGVQVMTDFGHNPQALASVLSLVSSLRKGGALAVIIGGPGDRSDADLRAAAQVVYAAAPTRVFCRDLQPYLRGRAPGEVPALMREELLRLGLAAEAVHIVESEADAVRTALATAKAGDFILLLVHLEHEAVRAVLTAAAAASP